MTTGHEDEPLHRLSSWIGTEDSNWTHYSSELVAKTVLVDFRDRQWDQLQSEILNQPEYWQHRCAVALGQDRTERAIAIMKLLLVHSQHRNVRIEAVYELDWAEVPMESDYGPLIRALIASIPVDEIEPEFYSLLAKADAARH